MRISDGVQTCALPIYLARHGPVREIAVARDLHRAEDRKIDMTAADHRETVSRREEARRRKCGDRLLAGVDEIGIDLIIIRKGADAEHAVFRLEDDLDVRRRSEEHTSELQSLMRISYAVFCLKK